MEHVQEQFHDIARGSFVEQDINVHSLVHLVNHVDEEVEEEVLEDDLEGVNHTQTRLVLLGELSCFLQIIHHDARLPVRVEAVTQNLPDLLLKEELMQNLVPFHDVHGLVEGRGRVLSKVHLGAYNRNGLFEQRLELSSYGVTG